MSPPGPAATFALWEQETADLLCFPTITRHLRPFLEPMDASYKPSVVRLESPGYAGACLHMGRASGALDTPHPRREDGGTRDLCLGHTRVLEGDTPTIMSGSKSDRELFLAAVPISTEHRRPTPVGLRPLASLRVSQPALPGTASAGENRESQ